MTCAARFDCDRCGKCYRYKQGLASHKRYECGKEPQFMCPHCDYRAKQKQNLKTHIIIKHCIPKES
ncbi:unnamed protein product [Nezara viridula]|uniref:C2H2-type domain-containing protein n=1 Tax=Nezara viridula TaxID=85310 RepID=A0A9P0HCP2_NEZVI|nr:unnamed protein product [Nezara viridula]